MRGSGKGDGEEEIEEEVVKEVVVVEVGSRGLDKGSSANRCLELVATMETISGNVTDSEESRRQDS